MRTFAQGNIHSGTLARVIVLGLACTLAVSCNRDAASSYGFTPKGSAKSIQIPEQGAALGDPGAPVTIEEYSDFQCPFCKEFADHVEPRIIDTYVASGKARIVFHSLGNWVSRKAEGNTESLRTAEAACFAADRNRFWQLHDLLFSLQGRPNSGVFSDEKIIAAAGQVGLDAGKLRTSLTRQVFAGRVQKDHDEGIARGVTSVPTFFINGHMIAGAQPYDAFKSAIDDALRAGGETKVRP
jgi:protein-disulfide isomerase